MAEKKIIVGIRPDGVITVRAEGYQGPGCVRDVRRIAEALGITVEEDHLPEFYLQASLEGWQELEVE